MYTVSKCEDGLPVRPLIGRNGRRNPPAVSHRPIGSRDSRPRCCWCPLLLLAAVAAAVVAVVATDAAVAVAAVEGPEGDDKMNTVPK